MVLLNNSGVTASRYSIYVIVTASECMARGVVIGRIPVA